MHATFLSLCLLCMPPSLRTRFITSDGGSLVAHAPLDAIVDTYAHSWSIRARQDVDRL